MSLSDIVDSFQRGKKMIVICTILGGLIAALFLFQQRVFRAEAHFLPPSAAEVEPLNIRLTSIPVARLGEPLWSAGGRGEQLSRFSPAEIYGKFLLAVQSQALHRRVLEEQGMWAPVTDETTMEERAEIDESFQIWESGFALKNDAEGPDVVGFVRITQLGKDPLEAASFLNRVAELAAQEVLADLKRVVLTRIADRRAEIKTILANERARAAAARADEILILEEQQSIQVNRLRNIIEFRKQQIEARTSDQITLLKEALEIAEAAGITDPVVGMDGATSLITLGLAQEGANSMDSSAAGVISPRVDFNAPPLFFRGSKVLKAELEAIQSRTSNDPFVEDLRSLEEQLQQVLANPELEALRNRVSDDPFILGLRQLEVEDDALAAIKLPDEGLAAMAFDQRALPPRSPVVGWTYLLPGILLGFALGLILAILQQVLKLQRKNKLAA